MAVASITGSITHFVGHHGLYAIFALMALDAVFPAASELVMVYGGALAAGAFGGQSLSLFGAHVSHGAAAFVAVALAGTLGYTLGALIGWLVGLYGGRPLLERRGRLLHVSAERLDRAGRWFEQYGALGVFLGRLTPVVRSFISIPAGVFRQPLVPYTLLTLAGSAIWCFALAGVGYGAGRSYERFHHDFGYVELAVVAGVLALAVYLVGRRRRSTRLPRRA